MTTVRLTEDQVPDLVKQVPLDRQEALFRSLLLKRWPAWVDLATYGEERMREVAE